MIRAGALEWPASRRARPGQAAFGRYRPSEFLAAGLFVAAVLGVLGLAAAGVWAPLSRPAALGGLLLIGYGVFIEPFRVRIRRETLPSRLVAAPVRIAHVSDTHLRRWSAVEDGLLERLREARPDLILMTGDYTASRFVEADMSRLLRELARIAPSFASLGNSEESRPIQRSMEDEGVTWLDDEGVTVPLKGAHLRLYGVSAGNEALARNAGFEKAPDEFGVCLYHYPDLLPELDRLPYDLMLCGHTHGGQVRLPWVGALLSMSRAGTRFARGFFRAKGKAASVSAGVGCESYGLPRLRFLCPPEVVVIDVVPGRRA